MKNKKLFLLDVYPILFRSHFAMINQPLTTASGVNTSAILGFCNYLFQILFKEKPTHIAAAFDSRSEERTQVMETYKANRESAPEDISVAREYVVEIIEALNIEILVRKGYEADDLIGTMAIRAAQEGFEVYIVSPDKDFAQLASDKIKLYRPSYKGLNFEVLDGEGVKQKFGVPPELITDWLALKGDAADNIPGVPKIGEKTAIELLDQFGPLESILSSVDKITRKAIAQSLKDHHDAAILSKKVATINTAVEMKTSLDTLLLKNAGTEKLVSILDELEFARLKERIFNNSFYSKYLSGVSADTAGEKHVVAEKAIEVTPAQMTEILQKERILIFLFYHLDQHIHLLFAVNQNKYKVSVLDGLDGLEKLFSNAKISKITYNYKLLARLLLQHNCNMRGNVKDILLLHYILAPEADHQLDKIAAQELQTLVSGQSLEDLYLSALDKLKELGELLEKKVKDLGQYHLYEKIELPLSEVLAKMETAGIKIDVQVLNDVSKLFREEMTGLEKEMFEEAGGEFNVNSPKQVSELFLKIMSDTKLKKTKTGQVSTNEAMLLEYAQDYRLAQLLLRHRKLNKLVSTYTESLPDYIDASTGRIHADFQQTRTSTGRLSCINPNLQNLPIRLEEGKEVRRAVVPSSNDRLLLSADYSQIELRLLAGLSKDKGLINAFAGGEDVHTVTAAKVFGIHPKDVDDNRRSKAKMVNYGIAYGMSVFGLSQRLKIPMSEAKEIIESYFEKFPGIRKYIDQSISAAKAQGYSMTSTGRRRYMEDILSRNSTVRKAAERIAINAPIQGLAADIIKIAMIHIDQHICDHQWKSKMILQIHDELLFEVPVNELQEMKVLVKEKMEKAIPFTVPLEVNIGIGKNWLELEEE